MKTFRYLFSLYSVKKIERISAPWKISSVYLHIYLQQWENVSNAFPPKDIWGIF